jgi:hypothetical protein
VLEVIKKCASYLGVALYVILLFKSLLYAPIGIGMKFATVILERVTPGRVYNINKLKNVPLILINTGTGEVEVGLYVEPPPPNAVKEGYEPIPDPTWIQFIPDKVTLKQNEKYYVDVVVSLPDDQSLIGKHYEAIISAQTGSYGMFSTGVAQKFYFSIGVEGPEAVRLARQKNLLTQLNFEVDPDRMFFEIPAGKKVNVLKALKKSIKMVNKGDTKMKLKLVSVPNERGYPIASGYELTPSTGAIWFAPAEYKVKSKRIKDTKMFIEVPDTEEWRGKKYMFLVKTIPIEPELPIELYTMVYVTVK